MNTEQGKLNQLSYDAAQDEWKLRMLYDSQIEAADLSGVDFCDFCGEERAYTLSMRTGTKEIKGESIEYDMYEARCEVCQRLLKVDNIDGHNEAEADRQYRRMKGLVSVDDIKALMAVYRLGKAPLSLALGFGEITVTRYLAGSLPSKEYSDVIKAALESPEYMMKKLEENERRLGDVAYKKALRAAKALSTISVMSDSLCRVISYFVKRLGEVTPMGLQAMLYFAQGIYIALFQKLLVREEFQAYTEGVTCGRAYDALKSFSFDLKQDERFYILKDRYLELTCRERRVIDAVVEIFGVYSGATLSKLACKTAPWVSAARGEVHEPNARATIDRTYMKKYFDDVNETFDLSDFEGIKAFLRELMYIE